VGSCCDAVAGRAAWRIILRSRTAFYGTGPCHQPEPRGVLFVARAVPET
jgi:hypothetical protein